MPEIKEFNENLYIKNIIPIIKAKNGLVTAGDIALETSYPVIHIKYVLNKLAAKYLAEMTPTENGDLLYKFNNQLKEVGKFGKIAKKIFNMLLDTFKFLFKIVIMLTLVIYMIFYILVIIALVLGLSAATDNDSDSDFGGDFVLGAGRVLFELIYNSMFFFSVDPYEKYRGAHKRPFYIRVFSFIFGDDEREKPFNHDNNILKYLKSSKQITLSQAINLTGLSEADTRAILVNMVVKYNGDIIVNDDGVIIYTFSELEFTGENNNSETPIYAWNREKLIPQLNYNRRGENIAIICFNLFNLAMASFLLFLYSETIPVADLILHADLEIFFVIIYPLVFSALFFIVPLLRLVRLKSRIIKVQLNNGSLRALKQFFDTDKTYTRASFIDNRVKEKIFLDYPNTFVHDFIEEKEIVNLKNYKSEMLKELA